MQLANLGKAASIQESLNVFGKTVQAPKNGAELFEAISEIEKKTSTYSGEVIKLALAQNDLDESTLETILSMTNLKDEEVKAAVSAITLSRSQDTASKSTKKLSDGFKGLTEQAKRFVVAHPVLTIVAGVAAAVVAAQGIYDATTLSAEEALEKISEVKGEISSLNSEIKTLEENDDRTLIEEQRLEFLKEQLKLQEQLLEVENRRLANARLQGSGWFGMASNKEFSDTGSYKDLEYEDDGYFNYYFNPESLNNITRDFEDAMKRFEGAKKRMETTQASGDQAGYEYALGRQNVALDDLADAYGRATEESIDYATAINQIRSDLAAGYYGPEGGEKFNEMSAKLDEYVARYQTFLQIMYDFGSVTGNEKAVSTVFDYIIEQSGIAKEKLIAMAEDGSIEHMGGGLTNLTGPLGSLAKLLEQFGVPAEAFIDYLENMIEKVDEFAEKSTSYTPADIFAMEDAEGNLTTLGKISEEIDKIQNAYKTLSDAIAEYDENGAISIDTLQDVINLGDNWMDYVDAETGALKLDKEALQELTASRLNDLRVQALTNLAQNVEGIYDDISAKKFLTATNYDTAKSYEALAESMAKVSFAKIDEAVSAGNLSLKNAHLVKQKYLKDQKTINALFDNVSITDWGIGGGSGSGGSSSTKDFEETYDFFEDRIDNLNDAYELLESNIENVNGAVAKNNLINAQYDIAAEKLNNYNDALDMYKQKANEALSAVPADMVDDVVNGAVKITDFIGDGNEAVVDAIKDYNSWADKVSEVTAEIAALQEEMRQLELSKFNNIAEQFDSMFDIRGGAIDNIQKQIDLLETSGQIIGEAFYTEAIAQTEKQIDILNEKRVALANQLADSLASGRIQAGTDEWLEMVNTISEVEGSILDAKNSVEEFNNSIQELHWDNLERVGDAFDGIADELSNISDLYDDMDVASKDGTWSDEGLTQLGMAAQQYELARYEAEMYGKEIEQLKKDYAEGKYSATEYAEKLAELNGLQWDSVQAAEDAKEAMVDLNEARVDIIVEGIREEIEAYEELTQAKIDELEAERDLKNYRDQLADQTKDVADLEKQREALSQDTTLSGRAQLKLIEEKLAEARKNLADTEYDHSIDEQTEALNKQLEEFTGTKESEIDELEEYVKDTERVMADSFETVKENAEAIAEQLEQAAKKHGVVISDTIMTSWKSGEIAVASYGQTLTAQTSVFTANLVTVQTGIFQLQTQANVTAQSIANMFGVSADKLIDEMQKSYNSAWNVNNMMNALRDSMINTLERGYDVSSIINNIEQIGGAADGLNYKIKDLFKNLDNLDGLEVSTNTLVTGGASSSHTAQGSVVTDKFKVSMKYASGTKNAKAGWAEVDEEGEELKFITIGDKKYQLMNAGDQVIPHEGTERLWAWSNIDPVEFAKQIREYRVPDSAYKTSIKSLLPKVEIETNQAVPNWSFNMPVTIQGNSDTNTVKQMEAVFDAKAQTLFRKMGDRMRKV